MPIERYLMPTATYHHDPFYYLVGENRVQQYFQARPFYNSYTVRVHAGGIGDFFRNRVTVPEENPIDPTHNSKTFNRGSLIRHLNIEIRTKNLDIRELNYGYCGGWVGGSGDQRIIEVYSAVFSHYQEQLQRDQAALLQERNIEPGYFTEILSKRSKEIVASQLADEKTYFDGAVTVRLYRVGEYRSERLPGQIFTRGVLEVITKDEPVEGTTLIDSIIKDTFKGALYPIVPNKIVVRSETSNDGVVEALVESLEKRRIQADMAIPRPLCLFDRAAIQGNEAIAEQSLDFPNQYPLAGHFSNVGGIEGVDLYLHRINIGAPYSIPEGGSNPYGAMCLLRIVIRNDEVDIRELMNYVKAMRFQNLRKGCWQARVITVALGDPNVTLHGQDPLERRNEIINEIRAWQLEIARAWQLEIAQPRQMEQIVERASLSERRV